MIPTLLLALPLLASPQDPAPAPALRAVSHSEIDAVFERLDRTDRPGCAVGVVVDGELVHARGYGMANLEHGIANTADTIFRIGSTSKQFTAACMLLAEQDGALGLDDPLLRWVPELGALHPEVHAAVTLRHLVHHQSGIRDYLALFSMAGYAGADWYSTDDVLAMLARQEALNFPAGTAERYSNSGYLLIGVVLERATGLTLREFAAERIFGPLGMDRTTYCDDTTELMPLRAEGHELTPDGWRIGRTTLDLVGDGGVFTSVRQLARWDANFYAPVVGGAGAAALVEAQHRVGVLADGTVTDYAAGLGVDTWRGLRRVAHGGSFDGFRAELMRFPDQHLAVICLANDGTVNPSALCQRVCDLYLADLYGEAPPERGRGPGGVARAPEDPGDATLTPAEVAGPWYAPEFDLTVRLELEGDAVHYRVGHTDIGPFRTGAGDRLRGPGGSHRGAHRGADGSLLELELGSTRSTGIRLTRPRL